MAFFTAYCAATTGDLRSLRDQQFVQQQAVQTFEALDTDGSGMITKEERRGSWGCKPLIMVDFGWGVEVFNMDYGLTWFNPSKGLIMFLDCM